MDSLSWFIQCAPIPVILHEKFSIKTANKEFLKLANSTDIGDINLEQWISKQFKSGEMLEGLLGGINDKSEFHISIEMHKKGMKSRWRVCSFPISYNDKQYTDTQVTWFVNDSYNTIQNSYWDLHVRMNSISSSLMQREAQLNKTNLELKKTNEQLEFNIAKRKKTEEKLLRHTREIEKINKELDDFTYIVSHDLIEPLRSIYAFSKFIGRDCQDKLNDEEKHYLERIMANAARMRDLIDDLLEISRIERRKNPFEEVVVENIINEVMLCIEYAIKEKNVQIAVKVEVPKVFCDRVRLTAVFHNLLSNAIKFADKNPPTIEIGCKQKGRYYEFYVKDNGPGIEKQYQNKIFEIFQRLEKKEDYEGTGAGLTIAKKIVEMHKGKIWVESKVGEGSTFYFTISKEEEMILGKKLGEILVEKKLLTKEEIEKALEEQKKMGFAENS